MFLNKLKRSGMTLMAVALFTAAGISDLYAQKSKTSTKAVSDPKQLATFIKAVEKSPDSLSVHAEYIKFAGYSNPAIIQQYDKWMKKYPKSAMFPYALGKTYVDIESPKAKSYLLKTVAIDPGFAGAWYGLWMDAQRWGEFEKGNEYLRKATEAEPSNPSYAFYYSSTFRGKDPAIYRKLALDVAKRFPTSERGAQALYWLAVASTDTVSKLETFELLRKKFPIEKFTWSVSGMSPYYELLLEMDTEKGLALATEMSKISGSQQKDWENKVKITQDIIAIKQLIQQNKRTEALALIRKMKLPWYFKFHTSLTVLKGKALAAEGDYAVAYDSLIVDFAKTPNLKVKNEILKYGMKIGKNESTVNADTWAKLDAVAKPATPFTLKKYLGPGSGSLSDYQGKVVLLTYWFPGCGPCRGEFPHFENVIRKFKGKAVDYLGINIVSEQNEYVIPFMQGSGYSFTPLEDVEGRVKGNLDNRGAAPANFLIDQKGRVIFSDFRINADNEDELELMINLILSNNNK